MALLEECFHCRKKYAYISQYAWQHCAVTPPGYNVRVVLGTYS